ncbi:tetratricopeptide repeat protein [Desulfosediminicola sp.]|uniref:tetratricopeptide repeat protein n=1 Tax=Desulfosediminicola sp. TaxID=2886825 RepID=UPI003AF269E4
MAHRNSADRTLGWEMTALAAFCLLLLTPFIYLWRMQANVPVHSVSEPEFVGTRTCGECHLEQHRKWQGSDHDKAMAPATPETVLGDFADTVFTDPYTGKKSRFFRRDNNYFIETEDVADQKGVYQVAYTFGHYPLQQYLIPMPGGRMQCYNIAWDVDQKRWYRLPPYDVDGVDDWLHWTGSGQNWNGMCAECHSTRLKKNYDPQKDSYSTSWFEINVGCEACHGPGSEHVKWARQPALGRSQAGAGLAIEGDEALRERQISLCAPCHARRYQLGDNQHDGVDPLDMMVPALLTEELYYPDGQIKEEVYVYGSFIQSKMYLRGVRCNDCHDSHSLQTHRQGNELCTQCHRRQDYDTPGHHFHKKTHEGKPSKGYLCVSCHMSGRVYMGIDYRPDHSLRVPRPDLSISIKTPNSCSTSACHGDKSLDWVNEKYGIWYGQQNRPHYGEAIEAGRARKPEGLEQLKDVAEDTLLPPIVRATAISLLANYPGQGIESTIVKALESKEGLLRHAALRTFERSDTDRIRALVAPKLYDPSRAVRLEAAARLAGVPGESLRQEDRAVFQETLSEYRQSLAYNADFASQRHNEGNLEWELGDEEKAARSYLAALKIDDRFIPAKVNLAMLYNRQGNNRDAIELLQEVLTDRPTMYEVHYSLGLLLSELNRYDEAVVYLQQAAEGMPGYSRVRYNFSLALFKLQRWQQGANVLRELVLQNPEVSEYFVTLVNLYLNFGMGPQAEQLAYDVLKIMPDHPGAKDLLKAMRQNRKPQR